MRTRLPHFAVCLLTSSLFLPQTTSAEDIDFDSQVAPILASRCLECHGGAEPKGGLSLTTAEAAAKGGESGAAIVQNKPAESLLWGRVDADEMPPKHPLDAKEKRVLKQWISQGGKWGTSPLDPFAYTTDSRAGRDWWSLQPLKPVADGVSIDHFVLKRLSDAGLQPAHKADPRTLIRRLYFDLTGLPPSPEEVQSFENDPSPEAWNKLIEKLLASHRYGERWGRHWLDVVRFGESDGFERNNPRRNSWPYRDWVINAFNNDLPYDQFVRMQLIGDKLVGGVEGAAATGFWVAGVHNTVVGGSRRMKLLARQDELEEVLATVGQTFVGLTVNCARCHDHKFDPISQKEFYRLSSAISGLGYGEREEQSAEAAEQLKDTEAKLSVVTEQLNAIDSVARKAIIEAREKGDAREPELPKAFARWEFDSDLRDSIGNLHGQFMSGAKLKNGALIVDGKSWVQTAPLAKNIGEKTLEAWVQLDNLTQRGGGVISIEKRDGVIFDAIVFGEREAGQWMAGSNGFVRTDSFQAPQETEANSRPVHMAIVYQKDGTITAYRNGVPYGRSIRKAGLQTFNAGDTEIVFGLRHKPPGGNRQLSAKILSAALYDRALSPGEIAATAGNPSAWVPGEQIVEWLPEAKRKERSRLKTQVTALNQKRESQARLARQRIYTLTPGGGAVTNVLLRGDPDKVGDQVTPGAVGAVSGVDADFGLAANAPEADRRRQLADWITSHNNPLFARVIVNRIWHYHFGTGIVDTPNDLGFNGGRPSHPELLEFLAAWFRNNGYSIKKLHRLILTSSTWQQAGYIHVAPGQKDPASVDAANRLLWRMTPRRLEAESIRDAMLAISGTINLQMGGPSFEDVKVTANNGTNYYTAKAVDGPQFNRRTVYRFNPRGGRSALLDTFDCPDPAATAPRRAVTTTPLQALSLLNNSFVLKTADEFAARVAKSSPQNVAAQVKTAWQLAVGRLPTDEESQLSQKLVMAHGLPALCRGLFNINEFVVIE